MASNVVERVVEIEAEADRLVAEARDRTRELAQSLEGRIASLREELERAFKDEMASFTAELDRKTAAEEGEIDKRAGDISARLASLDSSAVSRAVDFIAKRLRGDD